MKPLFFVVVAALVVAVVVAVVSAAFLGVAVKRWTDPSGAACGSLPTTEKLWPDAARELKSESEFDELAKQKGRATDSLKTIVVCGELFFLGNDAFELHFDFVDRVIGLTHSRITFDRLAYFSTDRSIINAQLTRLSPDSYAFSFWPTDDMTFDNIVTSSQKIKHAAPWIRSLVWVPGGELQRRRAQADERQLAAADVQVQFSLAAERESITYNAASSIGLLRLGESNQFDANSIVLFAGNAPPDISRVAGILSSNPQAPLSHTNVRAVHNRIPNAFLVNAASRYHKLFDTPVKYTATEMGQVTVEPATYAELNAANAARRAASKLVIDTVADLGPTLPVPLNLLRASDAISYGTKAANVAEMLRIGPELNADVPNGFAVPFGMFNQHMTMLRSSSVARVWNVSESRPERQDVLIELVGDPDANDGKTTLWLMAKRALQLRTIVNDLVGNATTASATMAQFNESVVQMLVGFGPREGDDMILAVLRKAIRVAPVLPTIDSALTGAVTLFGSAQTVSSLRCRSSSSAEDLVDFSGAGLYDSYTHKFRSEGALSETVKQVWGSLFTQRAVAERDAAGLDHLAVYMGVLVHPNYGTEQANGVAVTANALGPRPFPYDATDVYFNAQYGEVSVVNPPLGPNMTAPVPDIFVRSTMYLISVFDTLSSLRPTPSATVLSERESQALAEAILKVHRHFLPIYNAKNVCAFDLEWKVQRTDDKTRGRLAIKQVRPWAWGESCTRDVAMPVDRLGSGDGLGTDGIVAAVFLALALIAIVLLAVALFLVSRKSAEQKENSDGTVKVVGVRLVRSGHMRLHDEDEDDGADEETAMDESGSEEEKKQKKQKKKQEEKK
jgi:hypothetical protein